MRALQIVTGVFVVLSATAAQGQTAVEGSPSCDLPHGPGVSSEQLVSGQRQRAYRLFVPAGYDGHLRLPLVLDLHGSGGNAGAWGAGACWGFGAAVPHDPASAAAAGAWGRAGVGGGGRAPCHPGEASAPAEGCRRDDRCRGDTGPRALA